MSEFDVRKAIRAVMDETDLTAPEDVAAKVAESVPAKHLRSALEVALRDYVRISFHRASTRWTRSTPAPAANQSAKVTAIREVEAPRWLRERVYAGPAGWLFLGDCTEANLRYMEAERVENARRSEAAAEWFAGLAALVAQHKVGRVAELPVQVLAGLDRQAAA